MNEIGRRRMKGIVLALVAAVLVAAPLCVRAMQAAPACDVNLSVFISDLHVGSGDIKTVWGQQPTYQNARFEQVVDAILAMRPQPKRVVCFGDIALWFGWHQDYEISRSGFERLRAAGIDVYHTMGNHDHRAVFLKYYPAYAETSPVPGRIVSVVDLGTCDLLLLDSLQETPGEGKQNAVDGAIDEAQWDWLQAEALRRTRPFLCGAHHPPSEMTRTIDGTRRNVLSLLMPAPFFCGWIQGHDHEWKKEFLAESWTSRTLIRKAVLPSTGWWGDIGFGVMRTFEDRAVLSLVETDFYFPTPLAEGEARPARWEALLEENRGQTCTFVYRR